MERRSFLKFLLSTPLAAVIDYEQLLWVKEKTIFIPAPKQVEIYNVVIEDYPQLTVQMMRSVIDKIGNRVMREPQPIYRNITLDEAIKGNYVRPYEIESITNFMKKVNSNA